jgi:hypothetical protein
MITKKQEVHNIMTLIRTKHENNFSVISNKIAKDKNLSYKAKGIWFYAFTKPDDWVFYEKDLIENSKDGRDAVRSGLKELEEHGYLHRFRTRGPFGRIQKSEWIFFESPKKFSEAQKLFEEIFREIERQRAKKNGRKIEKLNFEVFNKKVPRTDFPAPENPTLLNTQYSNTKEASLNLETHKENTHTQKEPEPKKEKSSECVFSLFKDIPNFPENLKQLLVSKYKIAEIEVAVDLMKKSKTFIDRPFRWLSCAIERGYQSPPTKEDLEKDSVQVLKECFYSLDGKKIGGIHIHVGPNYVEFASSAQSPSKVFWSNEKNFELKVRKYLDKIQKHHNFALRAKKAV